MFQYNWGITHLLSGMPPQIPSCVIKHGWKLFPFIDEIPIKISMYRWCSIAMFDYQGYIRYILQNAELAQQAVA